MSTALEHTIFAHNMSEHGENKIHEDTVAKQYGFEGALVGGVNVYAYMANLPVAKYGMDWFLRGSADCRFHKPVYDGRETRCSAIMQSDGSMSLKAEMGDVLCATGAANLEPEETPPSVDLIARAPFPAPDDRPPGTPESLAEGTIMGTFERTVTADENKAYCEGVRESLDIYQKEGIVHPGDILRLANRSLAGNVYISPWMHVGSKVRNYGIARIDTLLTARGKVVKEYEHKGHKFVELDVLVTENDKNCIARIYHTAIYQPRKAG